jgi:hypothetical protein
MVPREIGVAVIGAIVSARCGTAGVGRACGFVFDFVFGFACVAAGCERVAGGVDGAVREPAAFVLDVEDVEEPELECARGTDDDLVGVGAGREDAFCVVASGGGSGDGVGAAARAALAATITIATTPAATAWHRGTNRASRLTAACSPPVDSSTRVDWKGLYSLLPTIVRPSPTGPPRPGTPPRNALAGYDASSDQGKSRPPREGNVRRGTYMCLIKSEG